MRIIGTDVLKTDIGQHRPDLIITLDNKFRLHTYCGPHNKAFSAVANRMPIAMSFTLLRSPYAAYGGRLSVIVF